MPKRPGPTVVAFPGRPAAGQGPPPVPTIPEPLSECLTALWGLQRLLDPDVITLSPRHLQEVGAALAVVLETLAVRLVTQTGNTADH